MKKFKQKNLTVLFLIVCIGKIYGQGFQFAALEYSLFPKVETTIEDQNFTTSFQELGVGFKMPIRSKNEKVILINSLRYDRLTATLHDAPFFERVTTKKNFHKIAYAFMAVYRFNKDWILLARAKPTLVSDLEHKIDGDDFIFQGTALVSKKMNSKLKLGAGLVYTTQTGEPLLLPAIQLDYHNNRHSLKMILPSHIKYLYTLDENEKYKMGLKARFTGGNYAVAFNGFDKGVPKSIDRVVYSRGNIGLIFNTKLTKMMSFELFGGISALRKYRFEDEVKTTTSFDPKNAGFFTIGLNFNMNKK